MYTIKTNDMKVPLKVFSGEDTIEEQCIEQMKIVSSLPFLHHHVALMPDGHLGIGASIGSVVPTKGVIVPSLVGVDIGCGMCAVKTTLTEISTEELKTIMGKIREAIPVGFAHHKTTQPREMLPVPCEGRNNWSIEMPIIFQEFTRAQCQVGTLGGGNHFIEIQKGSDGHIWLMIHSGSRNLGFTVANHYNELAVELNDKWMSGVDKKWELAFLPTNSIEGQNYITEMNYCVEFALANRKLMMARLKMIMADTIEDKFGGQQGVEFDEMINIAHNYASLENHFGQNVWVHRKGATLARKGTIGIIPGSQGSKSYIVEGRGNPNSFESCSHGAGRKMSRKEARRTLNLEEEQKKLEGVIHSVRSSRDLDEAPGSYKDIATVMANQTDLVDIKVELTPLAVVKG